MTPDPDPTNFNIGVRIREGQNNQDPKYWSKSCLAICKDENVPFFMIQITKGLWRRRKKTSIPYSVLLFLKLTFLYKHSAVHFKNRYSLSQTNRPWVSFATEFLAFLGYGPMIFFSLWKKTLGVFQARKSFLKVMSSIHYYIVSSINEKKYTI